MQDLFGLGEDTWWQKLLTRWERAPSAVRTTLGGGLLGALILVLFLMVNAWTQMPVG
jgi:hypothetical protein